MHVSKRDTQGHTAKVLTAGQFVGAEEPAGQYVPAGQEFVQSDPREVEEENFPALHAVGAEEPAGQYEPAGHAVEHADVSDVDDEYVPAGHCVGVQVPAEGQYVPAGHAVQDVAVVEEA